MASGYEIWRGLSPADGQPIVALLIPSKGNEKTGPGYALWILLRDVHPVEGSKNGMDKGICGNCMHRARMVNGIAKDRTCYVNVSQAPLSIWRKFQRGGYRRISPRKASKLIAGKYLRLGAYGDPAFVPLDVLRTLVSTARKYTGYTHQWRTCSRKYREVLMASVENKRLAERAKAKGYRTFRVRLMTETATPREVVCPASAEANYKSDCGTCGLCAGTARPAKDIVIAVHGLQSGPKTAEVYARKVAALPSSRATLLSLAIVV